MKIANRVCGSAEAGAVLRLAKLTDAEYVLDQMTVGLEDYYLGSGEAPGVWSGRLASQLDLLGVVEADALRSLIDRHHPASGEALSGPKQPTVRAIDATFSAPKSASLLWAFSGPETAAVVSMALAALGIRRCAQMSPSESLAEFCAGHRLLMVLDNCEHVLEAASAVAEAVVTGGSCAVLATSREPLGVTGERVWAVPSLASVAAKQLFAERAGSAGVSLPGAAAEQDVIAEICRRLDGIPLAIELAAARARSMSPPKSWLVLPLVLGVGRALFPPSERPCRLRLLDAAPTTTGVLMLSYAVER